MLKTFIILKALQFIIVARTPTKFDISSDILDEIYPSLVLPSYIQRFLNKFLVWDNVYFTDLIHNPIKYEHQFVFSPGWVKSMKFITSKFGIDDFYTQFLVSIITANIFQLLTGIILYFYSMMTFKKIPLFKSKAKVLSLLASQYFILSPGGIFLTSGYTENLGSFLSISGLFLRELSINHNSNFSIDITNKFFYLLSGVIIGYSYTVRANLLLLGIFYLYDVWYFRHSTFNVSTSFLGGLPLFFQFVSSQYYTYAKFCPDRGEWCNNTIPSLFQYCQKHYWKNGFLQYWTLNNLPNFILAFPIIGLNLYLVKWLRRYPTPIFIPYLILNIVVIFIGILFWNVQILTRIMNFNPIFYWFLSIYDNTTIKNIMVYWILIQTVLFAAFLPPA